MKAECSKEILKNALQQAERMTGKNLSLPVLGGVLLSAQKDALILRATNLDLGIEIRVPAKIDREWFVVAPSNVLSGILSSVYDTKVVLEAVNDNLLVSTANTKSIIKCLPAEDFPTLPTLLNPQSFIVSSSRFVDGVKSVWYGASVSDMKPEISSVFIYHEGGDMVFAATDSFRLAEKKITLKKDAIFSPILIPYKNMTEIIRICEGINEDIEVNFNKNQLSISFGGVYITSRIIDGIFPDYRQIIPKEYTTEAVVLKQDIINALKMTHIFSDKFNRVDFRIDPQGKNFEIEAKNSSIGENTTKIDANLSGKEISCGFNQKYIVDCFQAIKQESVTFRFSGPGRPLVIQGVGDTSFTYLVMPLTT